MIRRLIKIPVFLFLVFNVFFAGALLAQPAGESGDLYSPVNRMRFGNFLFDNKDYLRAIGEYRAFLKTASNDSIRFKFAECFFKIGRFSEAAENFKGLFFNSMLAEEARLEFFKANFFMNDFPRFRELTGSEIYMPGKYSNEIKRLEQITFLLDSEPLPDTSEFIDTFPDSVRASMMNFYMMKKYPLYKNPTTASVLSALLPGLGKIYTGEITDGITSFITTGLLIFLTADNFRAKHNFRGTVFGMLAALSYAGGIYGSSASAHIYNAGVKFNFEKDLKFFLEGREYFLPQPEILKNR